MNIFKRFSNKKQTKHTFSGFNVNNFRIAPDYQSMDYLKSYADNCWLYTCANKIATNVACANLIAQKQLKNGTIKNTNSKTLELLKHPNQFQSQYEFLEITDLYLSLMGQAFWYIAKDNTGMPAELWVISPMFMSIKPSEENYITGYVYNAAGQEIELSTDEVVYVSLPDPYNAYNGIGPAKAAGFAIQTDNYSNEWNRNYYYNSATPEIAILTEGELDDDVFNRMRSQWQENYGGITNHGKPAILEQVKDVKQLSQSVKDMDFVNLKGATRDEVLATFGIPKTLLGMETGINRATAQTAKEIFNENVIRPRLRKLEDKINNELVPLFGEDVQIKFQLEETKDPEFIVNTINQGVANGYITQEEAKEQIYNLLGLNKN